MNMTVGTLVVLTFNVSIERDIKGGMFIAEKRFCNCDNYGHYYFTHPPTPSHSEPLSPTLSYSHPSLPLLLQMSFLYLY